MTRTTINEQRLFRSTDFLEEAQDALVLDTFPFLGRLGDGGGPGSRALRLGGDLGGRHGVVGVVVEEGEAKADKDRDVFQGYPTREPSIGTKTPVQWVQIQACGEGEVQRRKGAISLTATIKVVTRDRTRSLISQVQTPFPRFWVTAALTLGAGYLV